MRKHKTYFNWSSGKDASFALYHLLQDGHYAIEKLITTVNEHHDRVSMHGLRRELLIQQAEAIGIPLQMIDLPEEPDMETYNSILEKTVQSLKSEGYTHCGFGDIFLADLRAYREEQLAKQGIQAVFPLWKKDTKELLQAFLSLGFKTITVCVNGQLLDESFVGRVIDQDFINQLPENVDPCGENGEFHTFCFDGPIFKKPIQFEVGEKIYRTYSAKTHEDTEAQEFGFWFCDLIPK